MIRTKSDVDFNIDRHLIIFLQEVAFYAEISRHIRKFPTDDIPTAGVTYDHVADELVLFYNPTWFTTLSNAEVRGILEHEFNHIVFGHLAARRRTPHSNWNIATDLAINSLIIRAHRGHRNDSPTRTLPTGALIPGVRPSVPKDQLDKMTPEDLAAFNAVADLIEKFPPEMCSEWYFEKIKQFAEENPQFCKSGVGDGDGDQLVPGAGSIDDHDMWDDIPEDKREYVESKMKSIVEKAVHHADSQSNGWGNIPQEIAAEIRRSVSNVVNWRSVLKQFIGSLVRGERTTSIKKINRRYPYIHPGVKRGYTAKLLIAIDESGSVDDGMLTEFFSELASLTKRVSVDILPFDCGANEADIFTWVKGTNPNVKRTRMGGTDFNAPTDVVNNVKNRGRWDGLLIMTDGQAPAPGSSRVKRGWVIGKGQKLYFGSSELQVFLDDSRPMTGAWR